MWINSSLIGDLLPHLSGLTLVSLVMTLLVKLINMKYVVHIWECRLAIANLDTVVSIIGKPVKVS